MLITSNIINFLNYKPQKTGNNFNFARFDNLAPLSKDTVSFTSRSRGGINPDNPHQMRILQDEKTDFVSEARKTRKVSKSSDKKMNVEDRGEYNTSQRIYEHSKYAYGQLKYTISYIFNESVIDVDSPDYATKMQRTLDENKCSPIAAITGRRKGQKSIAEKMASKKTRGIDATKNALNDLIGIRIILSGNSTKEGDYALEKITEAVKKGRLKVKAVKNHSQEDPNLRYATNAKINQLVRTARKQGTLCTYTDEPRDSGYLAIHILTDEIADGYSAEIQIMGYDVEKFKAVEDICYKCLGNKKVEDKYKEIEELFAPLKKNKKLKAEFFEYTKRAYANERLKPIHGKDELKQLLPIPSDLNIPPALDFNNIERLVRKADKLEAEKKSE